MPIPLTADLLISKILHLFYLTHPKGTLQCLKHSTAQHLDNLSIKLTQLKLLLPEIFCEEQIDFQKFQQLFSDHITSEPERYMLNWAGKSEAYRVLQEQTCKTLTPQPAESVNFDSTENIFIEGENLDVLKVLQKSYFNSIKMIYIDPPYNTGNDFVYNDNFKQDLKDYQEQSGELDEEGKLKLAFKKNSKENGHFHSKWLNMMLPRLHLAKNLLKDDGVIFISIDDNEQAQLKLLCDEVFGEENFVGQITVVNNPRGRDYGGIAKMHEYLLVYLKDPRAEINTLESKDKKFPFEDERGGFELRELRNRNIAFNKENRPNLYYPFYVNEDNDLGNGLLEISLEKKIGFITVYPKESQGKNTVWRWGKEKSQQNLNTEIAAKRMTDGGFMIVEKYRKTSQMARSVWSGKEDNSEKGTLLVKELFDGKKYFDFPKSEEMLRKALQMGTSSNDIILDFFAGSSTSAHAIMQLNAVEDNSNRRFICVQLPEILDEKSEAFKAGFKNIAEISKERIRRAGKQIAENHPDKQLDIGFKVFKLTDSHFKQWQSPSAENLAQQIELFVDPLRKEAAPDAILYEILLRLGLKLTAKVRSENQVFWVSDENGQQFALLLETLSADLLDQVISAQPKKVVMLDSLFNGDDALKKNAELQMNDAGIAFFVL